MYGQSRDRRMPVEGKDLRRRESGHNVHKNLVRY